MIYDNSVQGVNYLMISKRQTENGGFKCLASINDGVLEQNLL